MVDNNLKLANILLTEVGYIKISTLIIFQPMFPYNGHVASSERMIVVLAMSKTIAATDE